MNDQEKDEFMENAKFALGHAWETHRQAFGPILEPAFKDNPSVRIPLTAALNCISRREVQRGIEILQTIKAQCICNEDKAAWTFCVGLAFEMAGDKDKMMRWYARAGKYGHRFYLPYLKVAKAAYEDIRYDLAAKNYALGIECLLETEESEKENAILASAYVNFCALLTMMHRYGEAEQAWETAKNYPLPSASYGTAAILYAAKGDRKRTEEFLNVLKKKLPSYYEDIRARCDGILEGRNGHFSVIPFEKEKTNDFWQWFEAKAGILFAKLENEDGEALSAIAARLKTVCPLFLKEPRLRAQKTESGFLLTFEDFYAKTLTAELPLFFEACPAGLRAKFSFAVSHDTDS